MDREANFFVYSFCLVRLGVGLEQAGRIASDFLEKMKRRSASSTAREIRSRRQEALDRPELRGASVPRESAAGATSFPVKSEDSETRRLIDEALARKRLPNTTNQD